MSYNQDLDINVGNLEAPRKCSAGAGYHWLKQAVQLFMKKSGSWMLAMLLFFVVLVVMMIVLAVIAMQMK